jgi:hypothetical protein
MTPLSWPLRILRSLPVATSQSRTVLSVLAVSRNCPSGEKAAAWTEQDVGWVIDQPTIHLNNGRAVQLRVTSIFRREDGAWKLVHQHSSIGVPNDTVEAFRDV